LGGAIAVILMMFLKEDGYRIEKCITFGQPKITDRKGAEMCHDLPLLRVINHEDIVPLMPPRTVWTQLQGGYHHFGSEIILQHSKGYTYTLPDDLRSYPIGNFWSRLLRAITQKDLKNSTESIVDHDLKLYITNILRNIESGNSALEKLQHNLMLQAHQSTRELCIAVSESV
jgi:hypothetical protein